jgi:[histone H3]-lysine4 N-trimethyltransferase MLL3
MLCINHLDRANELFGSTSLCALCEQFDKPAEMLVCISCGQHYHGNCLSPIVEVNPLTRVGWQCPECKTCQNCKQTGDDIKLIVCDTCDKCYHTYCLKSDLITSININSNNGWKCPRCRLDYYAITCSNCDTTPTNLIKEPINSIASNNVDNYKCMPCREKVK